jgi:hypothetical protein
MVPTPLSLELNLDAVDHRDPCCEEVWHPRLNEEPAHAWFREHVRVAARTI